MKFQQRAEDDFTASKIGEFEREAPGHWRCVFFVEKTQRLSVVLTMDARWLSEEEVVSGERFVSERAADEAGQVEDRRFPDWLRPFCRYLRAEYYPEYA
jgi:hypothetical protein